GQGRQDKTFQDHILTHPDAGKLKYAVLYESTGRLGSMKNPNYKNLVPDFEYLTNHYFHHPQYLKIDGKPVVFIYLTRVYFRGDTGREALKSLRQNNPNLYLVGDDVFGPRYRESAARQWNAVTAYDVYGQSTKISGATKAGIERLKQNYSLAKRTANKVATGFIPAIAPGYNDRAVRQGHPGRPRFFTDVEDSVEGDLFRTMIRDVAIPLADPKANRMIMITSFNEWYEDTQIEETKGKVTTPASRDDSVSGKHFTEDNRYYDYGSLYLDILRTEFRQ
ncbi:MAG TPA: glycoside hydrolase family 99-like domain-containing protein, partial [Verrucomicrobiota bacterium]|nr:glycoside hydrolase family 99-like domain-containing protein [Verrucomicrobiota bacterium]